MSGYRYTPGTVPGTAQGQADQAAWEAMSPKKKASNPFPYTPYKPPSEPAVQQPVTYVPIHPKIAEMMRKYPAPRQSYGQRLSVGGVLSILKALIVVGLFSYGIYYAVSNNKPNIYHGISTSRH